MMVASALIFATRLAFTGWRWVTATICSMLINAGAAAARMESRVDTQAVEHAVQSMLIDRTTTRPFLEHGTFLIKGSLLICRVTCVWGRRRPGCGAPAIPPG